MTEARKKFSFSGKKVACHSVRKTGLSRLLDAEVPDVFVAQHAGMKSTESLSSYKAAGPAQMAKISNVLSNNTLVPAMTVEQSREEDSIVEQ